MNPYQTKLTKMKQVLISTVFAISLIISFSSCSKQVDQQAPVTVSNSNPTATVPQTFASIQAPAGFNWSTTNKVAFTYTGTAGADYRAILKVINSDGNTIFQKLQLASETYSGSIEVDINSANVTVQFGDISKSFNCKTGNIAMSIN